MRENSLKTILNGTVASTLAGVILLTVPTLRGYFGSFLFWLWSGVIWCWESLMKSYALPGWAWIAVFFFSLIGLANIFGALRNPSEEPEFKSYVEDSFHGAKWRWSWVGNQIANLWCYCPNCDGTLVYNDSSCRLFHPQNIEKTNFICENCGNLLVSSIKGGDKDYSIEAVKREIGRRIRTGEFRNTEKLIY